MWKKKNKEDWRSAVCRIGTDTDETRFGTGFAFARRDGRIYLLTCRHVLETVGEPSAAWVRPWWAGANDRTRRRFEIIDCGEGKLDIALIAVDDWPKAHLLDLRWEARRGAPIQIYGAGALDKKDSTPVARRLTGSLVEDVSFDEYHQSAISGWELRIDDDPDFGRLKRGYSGSPVWDAESCAVVAMVTNKWGIDKGYAIAVDNLWTLYPELERLFDDHPSVDHEYHHRPAHWLFKTLDHDQQLAKVERRWNDEAADRHFFWMEAGTDDWPESLPCHIFLHLESAALNCDGGKNDPCESAVIRCRVNRYGAGAVAAALRAQLAIGGGAATGSDREVAATLLQERMQGQSLVILYLVLMDHGDVWGNRAILQGGINWLEGLELPAECRLLVLFCCLRGGKASLIQRLKRGIAFPKNRRCTKLPEPQPINRAHVESWFLSEYLKGRGAVLDDQRLKDLLVEFVRDKERPYDEVRRRLSAIVIDGDANACEP